MTKEEILAMEVGHELDEIVAVEIMGWDGRYITRIHSWYPSTHILDAWKVVEALRSMEDGEDNQLLCCLEIYSDHDYCWEIRWSYSELGIYNDGHKEHRSGCFDDFPEAICKAALLIKMKEAKHE